MQNLGLLMEYEEILLGKKKDFTSTYIGKNDNEDKIIDVLKYAFETLMGWTPNEVRDFISPEVIKILKIQRITNKIEYPPELDPKKDVFFVAWYLYPQTIHLSLREIILNKYQKVLNGEIKKVPKGFFFTASGEINSKICLQYAVNQKLYMKTVYELYEMFSDKEKANDFLEESRLTNPCSDFFDYPVDMLHESLPAAMKDDLLYHYGKFKSSLKKERERNVCE